MGEFVQWNFSHNKENNCSNCGMNEAESKGCCDNQQKILKIDEEQKITNATYPFPPITSPTLNPSFFEIAYVNMACFLKEHTQSNTLHRVQNLPLFILNSIFRI